MTRHLPGGTCVECGHSLAFHGIACGLIPWRADGYPDHLGAPCECLVEPPQDCSIGQLPADICPCPQHRSGLRLPNGIALGHSFVALFGGRCGYCDLRFGAETEIAAMDGSGYAHVHRNDCRFSRPVKSIRDGTCVLCGAGFSVWDRIADYVLGGCVHAAQPDCRLIAPDFVALPADLTRATSGESLGGVSDSW